jgi:hypothetical protein
MNRALAIGFAFAGLLTWMWPSFNGLLEPVNVTDGEGRIAGAILFVGAGILWCMQPRADG